MHSKRQMVAALAALAYARTVTARVLGVRRLTLCLIAATAMVATTLMPASAFGAATGAQSSGTNLLESGSKAAGATSGSTGAAGTGSTGAAGTGSTGGTAGSTGSTGSSTGGEEGEEGEEGGKTGSGEESSGLGSLPIVFGLVGAAVLIGAIAIFIVRDARRNAPVPEGALPGGTNRMSLVQARKRRAKAKAARQQRKRNRPN